MIVKFAANCFYAGNTRSENKVCNSDEWCKGGVVEETRLNL